MTDFNYRQTKFHERVAARKQQKQQEQPDFDAVIRNLKRRTRKIAKANKLAGEVRKRLVDILSDNEAFKTAVKASSARYRCANAIVSTLHQLFSVSMFSLTDETSPDQWVHDRMQRVMEMETQRREMIEAATHLIEVYESTVNINHWRNGLDPKPIPNSWINCRLDVDSIKAWVDKVEDAELSDVFAGSPNQIPALDNIQPPTKRGGNSPVTRTATMAFNSIAPLVPEKTEEPAKVIRRLLQVINIEMTSQQARDRLKKSKGKT